MIPNDDSTAICGPRPTFASPEDWLRHYDEVVAAGRVPWPPETRGELLIADELGILNDRPQYIPGAIGLRILDLPNWFGRPLPGRSERWRERFIITMMEDPEFCSAVATCMRGAK